MHLLETVQKRYHSLFHSTPTLFSSPGRINVLGEHTDYNDGFVLPATINKEALFAVALNNTHEYRLVSIDMDDTYTASSSAPCDKAWANYLLGVVAQIEKRGIEVPGFNVVFGSNIPMGAGVSSSAAIECGMLYSLNTLLGLELPPATLAQMAQMAEHEYAGVKCGIMDQFAVLHGQQGQVIKLDCRSLDYSLHPFSMDGYALVLCDTGVKHSLASSAYNTRREECQTGVEVLQQQHPNANITALRDATLSQLNDAQTLLTPAQFNRCQYVIEENTRVNAACTALEQGDLKQLGQLMLQTHRGLQHLYEVSCEELDALVDIAEACSGVLGARMMGGGFGGCTINLVTEDALEAFEKTVKKQYYAARNIEPNIIITKLNDGTRQL